MFTAMSLDIALTVASCAFGKQAFGFHRKWNRLPWDWARTKRARDKRAREPFPAVEACIAIRSTQLDAVGTADTLCRPLQHGRLSMPSNMGEC